MKYKLLLVLLFFLFTVEYALADGLTGGIIIDAPESYNIKIKCEANRPGISCIGAWIDQVDDSHKCIIQEWDGNYAVFKCGQYFYTHFAICDVFSGSGCTGGPISQQFTVGVASTTSTTTLTTTSLPSSSTTTQPQSSSTTSTTSTTISTCSSPTSGVQLTVTAASGLHLRSSPAGNPILIMPFNSIVTSLGECIIAQYSGTTYNWYKIRYQSLDGWSTSNWLQQTGATTTSTTISATTTSILSTTSTTQPPGVTTTSTITSSTSTTVHSTTTTINNPYNCPSKTDCGKCIEGGYGFSTSCGWCKGAGSAGECKLGTKDGPNDRSCTKTDWAWGLYDCDSAAATTTTIPSQTTTTVIIPGRIIKRCGVKYVHDIQVPQAGKFFYINQDDLIMCRYDNGIEASPKFLVSTGTDANTTDVNLLNNAPLTKYLGEYYYDPFKLYSDYTWRWQSGYFVHSQTYVYNANHERVYLGTKNVGPFEVVGTCRISHGCIWLSKDDIITFTNWVNEGDSTKVIGSVSSNPPKSPDCSKYTPPKVATSISAPAKIPEGNSFNSEFSGCSSGLAVVRDKENTVSKVVFGYDSITTTPTGKGDIDSYLICFNPPLVRSSTTQVT